MNRTKLTQSLNNFLKQPINDDPPKIEKYIICRANYLLS